MTEEPPIDYIKKVTVNEIGQVERVEYQDGTEFTFKDFMDIFKSKLQTNVAGEVISWDDEWRYQKQIDPKTMEQYLDVVEAEGLVANSKFQLTRSQKIGVGVMIMIMFTMVILLVVMKNMGLFG